MTASNLPARGGGFNWQTEFQRRLEEIDREAEQCKNVDIFTSESGEPTSLSKVLVKGLAVAGFISYYEYKRLQLVRGYLLLMKREQPDWFNY